MIKTSCRGCRGARLKSVLHLGNSPLANNLLDSENEPDKLFPLELMYCEDCHNCQLSYVVPAHEMFDTYLYVSSTTETMRNHFDNAALHYISEFGFVGDELVVDIGSNDGVALLPLINRAIRGIGVEPAKNIAEIARKNGVHTYNAYFTQDLADKIVSLHGKANLVTASNVFAHADGLEEIANSAFSMLKENGVFIVEVQYLLNTIKDLTFDNIYHEHVNYWSVTSINSFFKRLGYTVYKVEHLNVHGGSIRVYVTRESRPIDWSVNQFLRKEEEFGIKTFETYVKFAERVEASKYNTLQRLKEIKDSGVLVVGYGSPAKATTVLNYYGVTPELIHCLVEDNPLKHNKIVPGVRIPIFSKDKLDEDFKKVVLVMAWNFYEEIKRKNENYVDAGIRFINIKDLAETKIPQ